MAAQSVFIGTEIELLAVDKDYPEIQANTSLEVAQYTSKTVAQELGAPALREDHGLFLNALNGIPGPYMNYFDKRLSETDLLSIYQNLADRTGYFEVATSLAFPDGRTTDHVFKVNFTLSQEARGSLQTGWNRIIILEGETRTLAEYPESERVHVWQQGYAKILEALL